MQWLDDDIYAKMETFLDPLSYKDRLAKIAIYIVLSSDDEFMMFDWTSKYFDQFKPLGETKLLIAPNSEHSLATGIPDVASSAGTWMRSIAEGKTEEERPSFDYEHNEEDRTITITIPEGGIKPKSVYMRHAETFSSVMRDFRWVTLASEDNKNCSWPWIPLPVEQEDNLKATHNLEDSQKLCLQHIYWHKLELKETENGSGIYVGTAPEPEKEGHWVGYYIEVIFPGDTNAPLPHIVFKNEYVMTTPGWVYPDTYPFEDCHLDTCTNTLV